MLGIDLEFFGDGVCRGEAGSKSGGEPGMGAGVGGGLFHA